MSENNAEVNQHSHADDDGVNVGSSSSYCFKWNDYRNHLSGVVQQLLEEDCMVDVTLSAAGERIHAHRIVLCACSSLFQDVLGQVNEDHPTIILSDISARNIKSIIEFTYHGEVHVPVEEIGSLLDAARSLRIYGLTEVDGFDDVDSCRLSEDNFQRSDNDNAEHVLSLERLEGQCVLRNEKPLETLEKEYDGRAARVFGPSEPTAGGAVRKRGRRETTGKRDYSDDMLVSAINDLREGQTLIEAATRHNIPRSTLYMRAKSLGIRLNASRNEYPAECMKAAIEAVIGGSSLQHASEMFGIPKTVLWRRIQKEGYQMLRSEMKRSYGSENREAAVRALERGENLTKVSHEFKIPKTTLFRDKARLVDEGKLPLSFWKKRKTESEDSKRSRLEEAVAACKGGKMSQAAASVTYHIPKTTIWRRLQQQQHREHRECRKSTGSPRPLNDRIKVSKYGGRRRAAENDSALEGRLSSLRSSTTHGGADFAYCEVASTAVSVTETDTIPITYIDENSIPEDSVIILTTDDVVGGLDLEEGKQIIVNTASAREYVPCAVSVVEEEGSDYPRTERS